ncbi:MAG TPA: GTPase [Stenomitos sp.]
MTQSNILELAKQGNLEAIVALLDQLLQPHRITTKASINHDCLKLTLVSSEIPDKETLTNLIANEIDSLELRFIKKIKIYVHKTIRRYNSISKNYETKTLYNVWQNEWQLNQNHILFLPQIEILTEEANSDNRPRERSSECELKATLQKCSQTAKLAYNQNIDYAKQVERILKKLNANLSYNISILNTRKDSSNFEFLSVLKNIIIEIEKISGEGIEELVTSLEIKRKHLEDFTIALFGRTKAGKSTIREALTRGDGGTIGKGAQRTTRDIHEYRWQGLRLLDTPGIEAYQGEEDTAKVNEVIDQCDMILFLASDDSVQPGEFSMMAQLKRINKYFAVILNVKNNLENPQRLKRFLQRPEKIFAPQRVAEHENHIRTHVKEYLAIDNVEIICIQAMAAFLSTQAGYTDYSIQLWNLSRIEEVYYLIAEDIKNNGQQRRVSTLFDGNIKFIVNIESQLITTQKFLHKQSDLMRSKKQEVENLIKDFLKEGKSKIEYKSKSIYSPIKEWIPYFIDNYCEKNEASIQWKHKLKTKEIEKQMKNLMDELLLDLQEQLKEFSQQYLYDNKSLLDNLDSINLEDLLPNMNSWELGKLMRRASVVLGAVGAGAFFLNPIVGLAVTGLAIATGLGGDWINEQEKREFNEKREKLKEDLIKEIDKREKQTTRTYQQWLQDNIGLNLQKSVVSQLTMYLEGLQNILKQLNKSISEIKTLKDEIKQELNKNS